MVSKRSDQRNLWDKTWLDSTGQVVIFQMPNVWLIAWAALTCASLLFNRGLTSDLCAGFGSTALIVWSLLEVFRGVNYFRRGLGLIVLIFSILSLVKVKSF